MGTHRVEKPAVPGGDILPTSASTPDSRSAAPGRSADLEPQTGEVPREDWRDLAMRIQHESDPQAMLKLADQLIDQLDPTKKRRSEFPEK